MVEWETCGRCKLAQEYPNCGLTCCGMRAEAEAKLKEMYDDKVTAQNAYIACDERLSREHQRVLDLLKERDDEASARQVAEAKLAALDDACNGCLLVKGLKEKLAVAVKRDTKRCIDCMNNCPGCAKLAAAEKARDNYCYHCPFAKPGSEAAKRIALLEAENKHLTIETGVQTLQLAKLEEENKELKKKEN